MQLSCTAAIWIALVLPIAAQAQSPQSADERRGTASIGFYADDDHMTVVSPRAGAQTRLYSALVLDFSFATDIVSGASVDVISEASPSPVRETRVEGGIGATWAATRWGALRAQFSGSHETDYDSLRVSTGARFDLADRNTNVDLQYDGSFDSVRRANDGSFSESRRTQRATGTVTQVLGRRAYADAVVEVARVAGYQANPYRTVPIVDPSSPVLMRVPEATPNVRWRVAALARARLALGSKWFLHADYRYCRDNWSVESHTVNAMAIVALTPDRLTLAARVRGYFQTEAEFYQAAYELEPGGGVPLLRTRERRLGEMTSTVGSLTADLALGQRAPQLRPHLMAALSAMHWRWPDFPAQSDRLALVTTLGVSAPF